MKRLEVIEFKGFTKEDYLTTTKPYEELYKHIGDKFTLNLMLTQASEEAKKVGITNFKTLFKAFCEAQKKSIQASPVGNVTAFTGQTMELDSGCWYADDFGVSTESGFGEVQACIHPIMPIQRLVNIDTNTEKLKIAYCKGGIWRSVIADRETLSSNKIVSLANCGIAVNSENCKWLIRYLHDVENINYDRIPEAKSIGRMGWIEGHGFSPYDEELLFDGEASFKKLFDSVREKGNLKEWVETARECRESLYARLVLDASFASALVQPLGALPFFLHLWGVMSGSGKTVALMLASSVWADPRKGNYWQTFDSTGVGQEQMAGFLNSMPLILDELQLVKDKKNFDKTIYSLAEGVGRTRGAKGGGIQRTATWANTIITSGEMPMTTFSSGAGALNRIIELNCNEKIIEDGPKISGALKRNFGMAGREFVEWLQEEGNIEMAERLFDMYQNELQKTDATDKQIIAAALVLTADALACSLFFNDKPLQAEDILPALKTNEDVDLMGRAYETITQWVAVNKHHFMEDSDYKNVPKWGVIDNNYYYIVYSVFEKMCMENDFNARAVLTYFKEKNLIECTKGKTTKTKRINSEAVACVHLKKPNRVALENGDVFEYLLEDEQEEAPF